MLIPLLVGCARYDGPTIQQVPFLFLGRGPAPDDSAVIDTADTAIDSADTGDTPDPALTCWLGADRGWTTCESTVPYDSSWGGDYTYPAPYDGSPQYALPTRFVDIDAIDANESFAPNFAVNEYLESYKGRYGILQDHMTAHLQDVRDYIGGPLIINSGYRSPGYNAQIGGVEYSRHMYGDGADLQADGWTVEELGDVCAALGAGYVGLYEDGHTHCDWRDDPLDPAYFPASRSAGPAPRPHTAARLVDRGGTWLAPASGFDEGEPFRRWTARDRAGNVLDSANGREYAPPPGTALLEVRVGGGAIATARLPTAR